MDFIKQLFKRDEILLMYKCGSYAFGTSTDISDEDYVVVLKDFKGITHSSNGKKEYFIFGVDEWKEKQEFSDKYDEYYLIFNDEILAFPNTIIYKDDSMDELIEQYKNAFKDNYKKWLKKVVSHYSYYLNLGDVNKNMYHLFRIKFIVDRYLEKGIFSLELSDSLKGKIIKFKSLINRSSYEKEITEIVKYLNRLSEVD